MSKISVCVPVYEMKNGLSKRFLIEYLAHLMYQSYTDFDIVVSDQSENDDLKKICDTFSNVLDIKYIKNTSGIKNAANNVNHATKHATGDIIKLLYMDDFYVDRDGLKKVAEAFEKNDGKWLICGFVHCNQDKTKFFDQRTPWYGNKYPNGDNTTGNPSTYAVRKECLIEMDENLLWIVDGEYFYRSYYHYGDPIIIPEVQVCFREHEDSAFLKQEFRDLEVKERKYVEEKYKAML
jgi:GT2 family glycosyltransferase